MAAIIENKNTPAFKKFKYNPPTSPAELIDCTNFILDFKNRKCLNVGLDPTKHFEVVVQILTPSRYVNISGEFLTRIFSLMGNILSFILNEPVKYKRNIFLDTDSTSLSSMVYRGESVLVIESKFQDGCRVLLSRSDLISLQYLEWSIFEAVSRKTAIIRPMVVQQFEQMCNYFKNEFKRVENVEEMATTIKNVHDDLISSHIPKCSQNFVSQLKIYAAKQLAEQCVMKKEADVNIGYDDSYNIIPSVQSPHYSTQSPPRQSTKEYLEKFAVDQNDGPSYFDFQYANDSAVSEIHW